MEGVSSEVYARAARGPEPAAAVTGRRWWPFAVAALLLGELLLLLGSYSTASLATCDAAWARWVERSRLVPQIALVVLTAFFLFRRAGESEPPAQPPGPARPAAWVAASLLAQLACFALLFRLSGWIFDEQLASARRPGLWLALWLGAASACTALGALACLPLSSVLQKLRRNASFALGAALLGLAAWAAGNWVADELRLPLRTPTLWMAALCLRPFTSDLIFDAGEFVFGTSAFRVRVAPQCSGFEGLGLTLVFLVAYLGVFRRELRFPQALLLPLLGTLAVFGINALRLALLVLLGDAGWTELAQGGFHSIAGTIAFCAVALGSVLASRRLGFFALERSAREGPSEERDSTAAHLLPFLLLVALGMLVQAFGEAARPLAPFGVLLVIGALLLHRREYALRMPIAPGLALALGGLAALAWVLLPHPQAGGAKDELLRGVDASAPLALGLRLFAYLLVVPLAEELAFRAYLLRRLVRPSWQAVAPEQVTIPAWLLSSAAFGLLHPHWPAAILAGALYGLVYVRSGSLGAAVLAHATTNALLAGLALAGLL